LAKNGVTRVETRSVEAKYVEFCKGRPVCRQIPKRMKINFHAKDSSQLKLTKKP